jgi:tetratricopeptide (TPR) repeat protein
MVNKGVVLNQLNRSDEALELYDDMIDRFDPASSEVEIVEDIETAWVNRGITLGLLERPEEAVDVFDSVVKRFAVPQQVARALAYKGVALSRLGREQQALDTYNHLMELFGSSEDAEIVEQVAVGMLHKGVTLNELNRIQEAIEAYDDVVRRFDGSGARELEITVGTAMVSRAVLNSRYGTMPDRANYERDLRAILPTLPRLDQVPESVIPALAMLSVHLGAERTLELIEGSPAEGLLLPMVTALKREVGREPRVAKEVSEIADDIRKELARLRTAIRSSDTMAPAHD